jgi:hypothetical protein
LPLRSDDYSAYLDTRCPATWIRRLSAALEGYKFLWIDAISIDQKDDSDKDQQVAQMRDIYSIASRAIIWLGDAQDASVAYAFFVTLLEKALRMFPKKPFLV